ncbi:hypothetical protein SADUNF_Sadunf04G0083600 [Salix dunnii]|uniref:Uncharacterized protein n=1 Tax=Salix dunnii TaxID=1413687 RepID=A0A835N0P8_9ROSI|nr:hypothetical protein SADUNF_Sadunf04G0083600 [Salix dunnii]
MPTRLVYFTGFIMYGPGPICTRTTKKWIRAWYPLLTSNQKKFKIDGILNKEVDLQLGHLIRGIVVIHVEDLILFAL